MHCAWQDNSFIFIWHITDRCYIILDTNFKLWIALDSEDFMISGVSSLLFRSVLAIVKFSRRKFFS